jgi:glutathione-independent formaldehyde dehydrogenase
VIYGAGPVELLAAYSATLKGAAKVMIVDRHPDRLRLAESIGAIPIDDSNIDPIGKVLELTGGEGVDRGCECVGWQAHDPQGHEHPNMTLNNLVKSVVRPEASVWSACLEDPRSPDQMSKHGEIAFDSGRFFEKGLRMGSGQTNVKAYNRQLCELIARDEARPSFIVSHHLSLAEGPDAYRHFDCRREG